MVSSNININNKNQNGKNRDDHVDDDQDETLVYGHRLSSVGPGSVTGDLIYEPSNIDLAMKVHYLRVVYFLEKEAVEGLSIIKMKECLFQWLDCYYESCGRFRRWEKNGRPYIKCNDCGVRFVEAKSSKTLQEWVELGDTSAHRLLVFNHVLGPELTFSPPVFLQITSLKCGGMSVGLSWAHVLGDAFSVSHYLNNLAQFINGNEPIYTPNHNKSPLEIQKPIKSSSPGPLCMSQVGPLGDNWFIAAPCEMDTFSFHVTATQLNQLHIKLSKSDQPQSPIQIQPFEALCAVIWQAFAKVGFGSQPNTVTVIKHDPTGPKTDNMILRNSQVVSSVKAHFSVKEAHPKELMGLIHDWAQDERAQIEEMVGLDPGGSDFILYGSNLTFVDLGETAFYGFELKGVRPRLVNCFVDGIGEEGVVLVLPGPKSGNKDYNDRKVNKVWDEDRIVTLILPKSFIEKVKHELKKEWDLII